MRFVSVFSGIGAPEAAWEPLGWTCVGTAETDPFASAVLAHHYPGVPNLGDVTADDFLQRVSALRPDVLIGGPPCQDYSRCGRRAGITGDRGKLTIRWAEIIHAARPRFAITENVPGWLSAGNAFGAFIGKLVGHDTPLVPPRTCGGRWTDAGLVDGAAGRAAWRVLDAQHFGSAQRRRRVFCVWCPSGGADPAKVLFEQAGLSGNRDEIKGTNPRSGRVFPTLTRRGPGGAREEQGYILESCGGIRHLTPVECERAMGFPDGYTNVPFRGRQIQHDGCRYRALGNSMAVPCVRWIGERIGSGQRMQLAA